MITRRLFAALPALLLALAGPARADFPERVIRLIVPFAPGGVTDTSGRLIAEGLSKRLGQQVIVENKPGASGNPGTASVAQAAPDGYTLVLAFDGTMVINPHVFPKIPFDTLKDFAPVGKIGDATLIIVAHPSFPGKTLNDIIEMSKKDPKGISYGTSGIGGTPHIAGELLNMKTGAKLVHIPYKGGGQAMADALGGNVPLVYTAVAGAITHVQSGKLNAIAVSSRTRSPSLPNTPTFIESGVADFESSSWVGILAPAKTPRPVIEKLNKELNALLTSPDTIERLAKLGIVATPGTPEQFGEQMKADLAKYGPVVKAANIKVE
jgi:tripartite-type tricarboxylate transporter receptor subunit TctC